MTAHLQHVWALMVTGGSACELTCRMCNSKDSGPADHCETMHLEYNRALGLTVGTACAMRCSAAPCRSSQQCRCAAATSPSQEAGAPGSLSIGPRSTAVWRKALGLNLSQSSADVATVAILSKSWPCRDSGDEPYVGIISCCASYSLFITLELFLGNHGCRFLTCGQAAM